MMPGRGDLGFIPNGKANVPNRIFYGGPGHPSKKGVAGVSQLSKMGNTFEHDTQSLKPELGSEEMITKRMEWIEQQERKMTATINETRSDTQRTNEKIDEHNNKTLHAVSSITEEVQKTKDMVKTNSIKLFNEIQNVYGLVNKKLTGFTCNNNNIDEEIEKYQKNKDQYTMKTIAKNNEWVMLIYPMIPIKINENDKQIFMKCKTVDKNTGQLKIHWVNIHETIDNVETKSISEFSLAK